MANATKQRVLRSGVTIADKYRIEEAVARGGFSVIYRGAHIEMERPVALKLLAMDDKIQPSWLERFTREARLASQLTHPNTVTIFDYGQDPRGFLYIVMEWVEGESLYRHLKQHGPMAPRKVGWLAEQILASLQEAHQRGFLHRDLKPSNIMLTRDYDGREAIKVLDFGIAKSLEDSTDEQTRITHQGGFVGTPRYASPEQLDGRKLSPAADIYSLGLLLWEALVGDPAVSSVNYGECVEKHLSDEPWRIPDAVQCPPGLATIICGALEKSVERRYESCRQMQRDLEDWLASAEARDDEESDLLDAAASRPEPAELGDESSAEEEELFGDLEEGYDRGEEPPVATYGPKEANERDEAAGDEEIDPFERELMAIAETSNDGGSRVTPRRQTTAGSTSKRRRAAATGAPDGARGGEEGFVDWTSMEWWRKVLSAGGIALAVLVASVTLFAIYERLQASNAEDNEEAMREAAEAAEKRAAEIEERYDDGLPSLSTDTFFLGLQRSGWQPVGKRKEAEMSDVFQTDARFTKTGDTVAVTVYETEDYETAAYYVETVEEPSRAARFGKTAIEVAPDAQYGSTSAVDRFMNTVSRMQELARDDGAR